jgi:hypothetical protein
VLIRRAEKLLSAIPKDNTQTKLVCNMNPQRFGNGNIMKKAIALLSTIAVMTAFAAPAFADGFSGTLNVGSDGGVFSIRGGLNYSLEVSPNLFVGASLNPSLFPGLPSDQFGLQGRVAAKYVLLITKTQTTSVNAYLGTGVNLQVLPQPVSVLVDINAGGDGYFLIAKGIKVYGGIDTKLIYAISANSFGYDLASYGGFFFEPVANLEGRIQVSVGLGGSFSGASTFRWNAETSLYYAFMPQLKVGVNLGYGSSGFSIGLGVLFTEKPGSLGIAGNYVP